MRTRIRELVYSSQPPGDERGPISQARKPRFKQGACPRSDGDSQPELDPGESSLQGPRPQLWSGAQALRRGAGWEVAHSSALISAASWGEGRARHDQESCLRQVSSASAAGVCARGSQRVSLQGARSSSSGPRTPWASSQESAGPEVCPRGSCTSEASVPLNSKTFTIRGGNLKMPSIDLRVHWLHHS